MFRFRRVLWLIVAILLIGASSTGFSRSACGKEVGGEAGLVGGGFNEERDFGSGDCVQGNGRCFGFH